MEIITGLWLGQARQANNMEWCQEKKIQSVLNCNKLFETEQPIDLNYVYIEKVDDFAKKAAERLLHFHYNENKNVMIVCETGRRISLLVLVYYLSSICHITRIRAFEIIKTKLPLFTLDQAIARHIIK
jgi:hypothetical protein